MSKDPQVILEEWLAANQERFNAAKLRAFDEMYATANAMVDLDVTAEERSRQHEEGVRTIAQAVTAEILAKHYHSEFRERSLAFRDGLRAAAEREVGERKQQFVDLVLRDYRST